MSRDTVSTQLLRDLERVLAPHPRVLLAVSGGLDSMVLLDAAVRVGASELRVATFDHRTGDAARHAASLVRDRCRALGVECVSARADAVLETEAEFRRARWAFLRAAASRMDAVIATAHTADDQVETVCLRVMRDAGARGIAGLYAKNDILRPFLDVWRRAIREYADARRLEWVEDPSNQSRRYARNRLRHDLLPAMRLACPSIDDDLLKIAREAAQWRDDVDLLIERTLRVRQVSDGSELDVDAKALAAHSAQELSVLWPALAARCGVALDRRGIERVTRFTASSRVGARIQLSGGWEVVRSRDAFQLRASSHAEPSAMAIPVTGGRWGAWTFRPVAASPASSSWSATLPSDEPLTVRAWRAGDRMAARHGKPATLVKHFLSKAGVTGHERSHWPVVLIGDEIVWIPGVRRSDAATARPGRSGLPFVCDHHASPS